MTNPNIDLFESSRLIARRCRLEDAAPLSALMTAEISRWVAAWPFPLTTTKVTEILRGSIDAAQRGEEFPTIIVERSSNQPIGWLKLSRTENNVSEFELSYWIGEQSQRQGYAFEIASAAIDFAFANLSAIRVIAGAQTENQSSHALLAKLGMQSTREKPVWAPARQRYELCQFWQLDQA